MGTIYKSAEFNRYHEEYEPERFTVANESGMQHYSGSHVRVFFGDIHVAEIDSIGFQLAQNIRPVYGYHSHVWNGLQYGTRLGQGYFQVHLTESAYVPTILALIEKKQRQGKPGMLRVESGPSGSLHLNVGETVAEAVADFAKRGRATGQSWRLLADQYDAARWGHKIASTTDIKESLAVRGFLPPQPGRNDFAYNPAGTSVGSRGFTITLLFGDPDVSLDEALSRKYPSSYDKNPDLYGAESSDTTIYGTVKQLYNAHVVAGPNTQIDQDGKPIGELYTFICRDIL